MALIIIINMLVKNIFLLKINICQKLQNQTSF